MDIFIVFVNPHANIFDISAEALCNIIRARNDKARIVGVHCPESLTECVGVAEEIKQLLN
jgi:hypothetical protein